MTILVNDNDVNLKKKQQVLVKIIYTQSKQLYFFSNKY